MAYKDERMNCVVCICSCAHRRRGAGGGESKDNVTGMTSSRSGLWERGGL